MYKSTTRDVLVLSSGLHGYTSGYTAELPVGDLTELGINFIPVSHTIGGVGVYPSLQIVVVDGNTNGGVSWIYEPTNGNAKYISIGVGLPDPYNVSFGDLIQVSVNSSAGDTPEFSLSVKGK